MIIENILLPCSRMALFKKIWTFIKKSCELFKLISGGIIFLLKWELTLNVLVRLTSVQTRHSEIQEEEEHQGEPSPTQPVDIISHHHSPPRSSKDFSLVPFSLAWGPQNQDIFPFSP